ncbi:MAG: S-layer homology domain-containing protein [Thermoanaerobaculaceae bacterium]|jgi:hypothetical protein|nr:S-layer homology domain-containing protein [Thermoanaerobaculaceae bacterium]
MNRHRVIGYSLMLLCALLLTGPPAALAQANPGSDLSVPQKLGVTLVSGSRLVPPGGGPPESLGLPRILKADAPLSTAIMTTGAKPFFEASLIADWDGQEDLTADRSAKVEDAVTAALLPGNFFTRVAISAHTKANGFNENVLYYGDALGNVWVGVDTTGDGAADVRHQLNLPTLLNAFGTLQSDDQIVITGLAVSPVCDLTSFANVNGSFAPFSGLIGEILYVSFWDTGGGLRLSTNNILVRSGVLAFPMADPVSPAAAPPAIQSAAGFPITVGGSFGVVFSVFHNLAGIAVDDDGNLYFHQVDLTQFTGGNIVQVASVDTTTNQDRSLAVSGILTLTTLTPSSGSYGTASGPATQVNRATNYSGTSPVFGNVAALATGPGNVVYAAIARSHVATDDPATQATEGLFTNPAALGPTPSMIVTLADAVGATNAQGLPAPNGFADNLAGGGLISGATNYKAFVLGLGPDVRPLGTAAFPATTLKLDLQIDYTVYGGLAVDEESAVYVVSGGTPAGVGLNPSPAFGEIHKLPDVSPYDRLADYIDLRGDLPPNPPLSGGSVGDGDSDRYDHIFWVAPIDQTSTTPIGVAGLARGFLLYLNRTRTNNANATLVALPNGATQADDSTVGPLVFSDLDPTGQAEGGDDQSSPRTGDDAGSAVPLAGGFEFVFGNSGTVCPAPVWNDLYLNSNGSVSFGSGDNSGTPSTGNFLAGIPRVAGAWTNLNPASRAAFPGTFPVQALGFAGVNHFKVRYINVPEFGREGTGSSNTFAISLFDDGRGADENMAGTVEGPNVSRWEWVSGVLVAIPLRPDGSGLVNLSYGHMDLLGVPASPVLVGYSAGSVGSTPETNLSEAGRTATLGTGGEPAIFELFNATDFDLRFEGNDAAAAAAVGQPNPNRESLSFAGKQCFSMTPVALAVDQAGNGVLEVGETVVVAPSWRNDGTASVTPTGLASAFQTPGVDPMYFDIPAEFALYPAMAAGSTGTCTPPTCYSFALGNPGSRPAQHWDATFVEEVLPEGQLKTWSLHVGESFSDVPTWDFAYPFIENLFHNKITHGCGGGLFCPNQITPRWQMAMFLARAMVGPGNPVPISGVVGIQPYNCAPAGTSLFNDVLPTDEACPHIHYIYKQGVTTGCGGISFCPNDIVTRWQMAVFMTRAVLGGVPPPISGVVGAQPYNCVAGAGGISLFSDVSPADYACPHIHYIYKQGITNGCAPASYCPAQDIPRWQSAVFMVRAFGFKLYQP